MALSVAVSYGIDASDIRAKTGAIPLVRLSLSQGSPDCHWSATKQQALGQKFLETVITISNSGAQRIHLFLSAQNSVVFRFGRIYDKRNLPDVTVYQFQRDQIPKYAWGIKMPVAGRTRPEIV